MIEIDVELPRLFAEGTGALRVKLTLTAGSLTALVGPSGSGKTTLLRLLAGLETPKNGVIVANESVWFDSRQRIDWKPQQRSVGYVFQDTALFPNMTVRENICFATPPGQLALMNSLVAETGLTPFLDQKPLRLSGGQRQRVALARALVRRPQVLLLDEPFAALDALASQGLRQLLKTLHQAWGTTTVLVSHHQADVQALAQRVVRLAQGQIDADMPLVPPPAEIPTAERIRRIAYDEVGQQWVIETETTQFRSANPGWGERQVGEWL